MSDLATNSSTETLKSEQDSEATTSKHELSDQLVNLIDQANSRIRSMRENAVTDFTERRERLALFAETKVQIIKLISNRLGVLMGQSPFSDAELTGGDGIEISVGAESNASTITVTFPVSAERTQQVEFSFDVFHDCQVDNAVVEYRLQILPVFVKFVSHDQLAIPIGGPTDPDVVAWVDAKLVGFVATYFEVFFHPEYQKPHLVIDPVMGFPFPKSMAAGSHQIEGQTLYFLTDESCRQFNETPSYYLGTRIGSTVEPELNGIAFTRCES